jgi:two-component system, response regulator / RNA-binding antiterminator
MQKILLVAESRASADVIRSGLRTTEHAVASSITPVESLQIAIEQHQPTSLIVQAKRLESPLREALVAQMTARPLPIVVFAEDQSSAAIREAVIAGVAAYVVDGLTPERIPAVLEVAVTRFEIVQELRKQLASTEQKLQDRKVIERAKGLLMKARGLSEDDAYHTLRRMAMDRNKRIGEMAASVLEMADLLSAPAPAVDAH